MIEYAKKTLFGQMEVLERVNEALVDEVSTSTSDLIDNPRTLREIRRNSEAITNIMRFVLELDKEKAPAEAEAL